ncbi:MAG: hypothetical protein H5T60_07730 [Anaerolineae bacterium]|nr:hypothetical protein [Anaerolineae bacterium]
MNPRRDAGRSPGDYPGGTTVSHAHPGTFATAVPALDGKKLLEERCTRCHSLDRVRQSRKSEADWKATVERMVGKGAALSAQEIEAVVRYLAQTYPK